MKKGLIFATTLAMALGVGVAVGAHQGKAAEVKAELSGGETIYLDPGCWNTGSAWYAVYTYGSAENWVAMNPVADSNLYSATLNTSNDTMIFVRLKPSTAEGYSSTNNGLNWTNKWNQSADITYASADGNQYSITGWGDATSPGSWSTYVAPATPEYHLLGDFNTWQDPDDDYLLTADALDSNHFTLADVAMEKDDELKVCDVANNVWYGNKGSNVAVAEDGTYDVDFYKNADNDDHIVLTKQVAEPVYTISNRGFAAVQFQLDEDDKPEGVVHQYSAEVQYAKRGGSLEFFRDGVKITSGIGVDWDTKHDEPVAGNNVYGDTTNGFYLAHTVNYTGMTKIYLKTYSDGGLSVWGNSYESNTFHSYIHDGAGHGSNVTLTLDEDFVPDETYIRQYKTSSAVAMKALAGTDENTSYNLSDNAGLSEDVTPEAGATNNARQAYQTTAWKVHNDCTEVVYLKEKKTDLSLYLYVGGYEEAHIVTIGGQEIALEKDGDEYVAHGVALSAGDQVTAFTIDGVASAVTSKKVANNNLGEDKKVIANVASADIYYDTDNQTLWVSGLPAAGQHLLKNGNTVIEMNHTDPYDGYDQYASGMLTFAANDTIKVVNTGADNSYAVIWCPSIVATSTNLAGKFAYDSEKGEMKCVTACSAAVYLKIKSGVDEAYFGDVPEYIEEAVSFANGFKSAMATACSAEGKQAAVESAWALQATAYSGLTKDAKDALYLGSYSLVEEIQEFGERYMAIKQQHSDWNLENFLKWEIPSNGRIDFVSSVLGENSYTMIIIISIAAASALAFGTFFYLKKRKQK